MPIELQEKLCGIALSSSVCFEVLFFLFCYSNPDYASNGVCGAQINQNQSIDDINDIISDSESSTTEGNFGDVDDDFDESTSNPNSSSTTKKPKRKHHRYPKPKGRGRHRFTRQTGSSGSHRATASIGRPHSSFSSNTASTSSSNSHRATSGPFDGMPEIENIELTERQEKELQENLTTWLAVMVNKNKNLTFNLGHQFDDMILRCTIKNSNCTHPK